MSAEPISDADRDLVARLAQRVEWLRCPKGPGPAAFDWRDLKRLAELAKAGVEAVTRIRALEAEREAHMIALGEHAEARRVAEAACARKDAALRPFALIAEHDIGKTEADTDLYRPMQPQNARAPLPTVGDLRAAAAALGPWVPTHEHYSGATVRVLMRTSNKFVICDLGPAGDIAPIAIAAAEFDGPVVKQNVTGRPTLDKPRYRPLTPDQARAAVEGRSDG